jgi:putative flippase GtrA
MASVEMTADSAFGRLNSLPIPRWARFVIGGGLNTGTTYIFYLGFSQFLDYQLAFLLAYAVGIIFSYFFNAKVVFQVALSWRALIAYPMVYLVQYLVSAVALGFFVEKLGMSKLTAPITVAVATLPLTYMLSKLVILRTQAANSAKQSGTPRNKQFSLGPATLLLPCILVAVLLWLPFGPSMTGLIEEWDLLGLFNMSSLFYLVHSDGPLALHALRPLMPFTFATAYALDQDSFTYWHVLLFLSLVLKGGAISYLIGASTRSRLLAISMGVLVLLYPADTMQLSFRSLHIDWASALGLLAAAVFYASLNARHRATVYAASAGAALLFFLGCCMYEATLTIWPLPLLLLSVQHGAREGLVKLRLNLVPTVLWLTGALAYCLYAVKAVQLAGTYQSSLAGSKSVITLIEDALPKLFSVGALRALLGGWVDAARIFINEYSNYSYVLTGAFVIVMITFLLTVGSGYATRSSPENALHRPGMPLRLILVGLVLMLLGYAPFLVSGAHIAITQRTYIWATPGAAMVWVGALIWLSQFTKSGAVLVAIILTTLGLGAQLFQFHHYVKISDTQRLILKEIVQKFDGNLDGKTLVVLDGTESAGHTWMFLGDGLRYSLAYLYGHDIGAIQICHQPSNEWQRADSLGRKGTCIEKNGEWTFQYPPPASAPGYITPAPLPEQKLEKKTAVVVSIGADDHSLPAPAISSHRANLDHGRSTIARRYRGVLKRPAWPVNIVMFKDQLAGDHYKWSFGDYWSMELPTWGSGWREAEWAITSFNQNAVAWKTRENAQLYFDFKPKNDSYQLSARFPVFSKNTLKEQLRIELNGEILSLRWLSDEILEADIPQNALRLGKNRVDIKLPVDQNYYGLGTQMDWLEISKFKP